MKIPKYICLVFISISFSLNAQMSMGFGTGLHINQAYKNNWSIGNHRYQYSEALNLNGYVGYKINNIELSINLDYANIPQRFRIKTFFIDDPQYKFRRKTVSTNLNLQYIYHNNYSLLMGTGVLFSSNFDLNEELEKVNILPFQTIKFSQNNWSPFLCFGIGKRIKLLENIYIYPRIQYRVGLIPLNSSFQHIQIPYEKNSIEFLNVLYINKGNALIADINIIYYLSN